MSPVGSVVVWAEICTVRLVEGITVAASPAPLLLAAKLMLRGAAAGQGEHQRRPGVNRHRGWKDVARVADGQRQQFPRLQRLESRSAGSPLVLP